MDLYSSLGLVAAMALSALVAVWLLYKRSRRDEFPEETWDPYIAQKNREDGDAYLDVEDISGVPQSAGPTTVSHRLMAFGENPGQKTTEDKFQEEPASKENQGESEMGEQVELLAGEPQPLTDNEQDDYGAEPNLMSEVSPAQEGSSSSESLFDSLPPLDEAPTKAPTESTSGESLFDSLPPLDEAPTKALAESTSGESLFDSLPPLDEVPTKAPVETSSGESPFDALVAPKDVPYRHTVAELMGVGVINFSPNTEADLAVANEEERGDSLSDPSPSMSSNEESSVYGGAESESSEAETTESNEESWPTPEEELNRDSLTEPTFSRSDTEPILLSDEIPHETESSVSPATEPGREESVQDEEPSFTMESLTFNNDEQAAPPVMYKPETSLLSEGEDDSSEPVSLSDDDSDESVLDEYVSGIENEEQHRGEEASFTLESLSFEGDEESEPPVRYEPETTSSPEEYEESQEAASVDESSLLSEKEPDGLDEEKVQTIDDQLPAGELPGDTDVSLTSENVEASEFERGDLDSVEEAPMAFDMPSDGQEFIDTEEKAQEIPAGLETSESIQDADENHEVPDLILGEESIEPEIDEKLEQRLDGTDDLILDSSEMVDEPPDITLEPNEIEEESEEIFDAVEMEEELPKVETAQDEAMEPPKDDSLEGPVSEESMDVFSVLESERAESLVDMPQGPIGNAGLFDDEEDESELLKGISPEVESGKILQGMDSVVGDEEEDAAHDIGGDTFADESVFEPLSPVEEKLTIEPLSGKSMYEIVKKFVSLYCSNNLLLLEEQSESYPKEIEEIAKAGWDDICARLEMRKEIEAEEYLRIGIMEHMLGHYDIALVHFKEALRRAEKMGPVLNALGVTSFSREKIDPGISYFKEAIREAGTDVALLAASNRNLAILYQSKGDLENAAVSVVSALKCMAEDEDPGTLAGLYFRAGQLFRKLGEIENAHHHLSESTHLYLRAGDDEARTRSLVALSSTQTEMGEYDGALKNLDEAVLLCRNSGDKAGEALVVGQMGVAYSDQDQYTRALECYEKAIILNRSLGNRKGEGANLSNIGNIHYFRGDLEEALSAYEEALEINREQEHIIGQATILGNLARIYIEMKMFPDATERLRESLEMFRSVGAQTQMKSIQELIEELGAEQE